MEKPLDLEDSATQTRRFVDESARSMFELACEVTEPREVVSPTPQRTQAPESKSETTACRKAEGESRKADAAVFAASTGVEVVVRAPGKKARDQGSGNGELGKGIYLRLLFGSLPLLFPLPFI